MPKYDFINTSPFDTARDIANASARSYMLSNVDRRRRFEARAARRWGDWDDFLVFPAPLLWLEAEPALCVNDEFAFVEPVVIELWP